MPRAVHPFLVALALACGLPVTGHANPAGTAPTMSEQHKQARGKAHFARGKALVAERRYVEALVELTAGYELTGRPLFLFNMAECARALGDAAQARELYTRYLEAEANGPFANAARARLVELAPPAPAPPVAAAPAQPATIPPPREVAAAIEVARPQPERPAAPAQAAPSHTVRNVLLVSAGLALVAGSVALYVMTRDEPCERGCVDLR